MDIPTEQSFYSQRRTNKEVACNETIDVMNWPAKIPNLDRIENMSECSLALYKQMGVSFTELVLYKHVLYKSGKNWTETYATHCVVHVKEVLRFS